MLLEELLLELLEGRTSVLLEDLLLILLKELLLEGRTSVLLDELWLDCEDKVEIELRLDTEDILEAELLDELLNEL